MKRWIRGHKQPVRLFHLKFMPLNATCLAGTSDLGYAALRHTGCMSDFTLHVGRIRDLSQHLEGLLPIDVIEVPSEDFAGHAAVVNLPDPFSGRAEDADLAETLGRMLAAIARPVPDLAA